MSPIKSILVQIDGRGASRLALARQLGELLQAELTAMHAVLPTYVDVPFEVASGAAVGDLLREVDEQRRRAARAVLDAELARPGPPVAWAESSDGAPIYAFSRRALYADLVVMGQQDPEAPDGLPPDFVESVLQASGRPGLVVPYAGRFAGTPDSVVVAWKESAQSARAVSAALPLLRAARKVHVLHWQTEDEPRSLTPGDIERFLRRHGVQAQCACEAAESAGGVGESLLSMATDLSADLLVLGCYSHARAREWILGGVSRTILRSMTVPVLMCH